MDARINQLELKVLYDISRLIGRALNLDHTLEEILEILSDILCMNRATVTLKDEAGDTLSIKASHGLLPYEKKRGVYNLDEGVTGLIFRSGKPFVAPDIGKEPLFLNKTKSREIEKDHVSFIGVPIVLQGRPVGVLSVDRLFDQDVSFEEDIRFLTIVSGLMAQLVSLNNQVEERESHLIKANLSLKAELSRKATNFFAVGSGPSMAEVQDLIRKVAPTKAGVLLLGESGTGKSLVAGIIHELSERARGPFVKINCAALPDNLLESELFGYEKGAFTGATESKTGRVEEADGGTIFLDEIGELPMTLQAKLLRFLQEREFERLGASKTKRVDVRILAATNKELAQAVSDGSFREDLFYRLNVFPIRVPPLRERREDLFPLITFFREKIALEYGYAPQFTAAAMENLAAYSWPGNVREMENLIERLAIIFGSGLVSSIDLRPYLEYVHAAGERHTAQQGALRERERQDLIAALERHNGTQSRAAKDLGITPRQMGYKIKTFGLDYLVKPKARTQRTTER